jgi:hypothetical protein
MGQTYGKEAVINPMVEIDCAKMIMLMRPKNESTNLISNNGKFVVSHCKTDTSLVFSFTKVYNGYGNSVHRTREYVFGDEKFFEENANSEIRYYFEENIVGINFGLTTIIYKIDMQTGKLVAKVDIMNDPSYRDNHKLLLFSESGKMFNGDKLKVVRNKVIFGDSKKDYKMPLNISKAWVIERNDVHVLFVDMKKECRVIILE